VNDGYGNHDLWITKLDGETWKQTVSHERFYPDDMEMLTAWAIAEDDKCLLGVSQVGNDFFIPAELSPMEAGDDKIQKQARLAKIEQSRLDAVRDAELAHLQAEAEYRARYLRPGVPQHERDLAAVNLMNAEQLEERLLPEALDKLHPEIVAAICERYLKLERIIGPDRWSSL
jgi:hypothetical protein